jgi:hypothetical protein
MSAVRATPDVLVIGELARIGGKSARVRCLASIGRVRLAESIDAKPAARASDVKRARCALRRIVDANTHVAAFGSAAIGVVPVHDTAPIAQVDELSLAANGVFAEVVRLA